MSKFSNNNHFDSYEVKQAVNKMKNDKASGSISGINAEMLKVSADMGV